MTTALSSLRVAVDGDSSGYTSAMNAKVAADNAAIASSTALANSIDATSSRLNDGGNALARLSAQYLPGARNAQQFQSALLSLGRQIDQGNIPLAQVSPLLQGIYTKYGLVADAATLTSRGYTALSSAATELNSTFSKHISTAGTLSSEYALIAGRLSTVKNSTTPLTAAMDSMQRQVLALATGMGPMGVILSSLGPWGLAAAAGIGLASSAFQALSAGADDLARKATALQTFQAATGISTDQIQALDDAAAGFGITSDVVARDMETFASAVGQAQQGTGTLFTSLLKINPQLALQVSGAHDVATAFGFVANAYAAAANAGNAAGAAAISRAAFGRQGAASGPALLGTTANAGALGQLGTDAASSAGAISANLIPQLVTLNAQLDVTKTHATNAFESLFAPDVLSAEVTFYKWVEDATTGLAKLSDAMGSVGQAAHGIPAALLSLFGLGGLPAAAISYLSKPAATPAAQAPSDADLGMSVADLAGLGGGVATVTGSTAALLKVQQQLISSLQGTETPAQSLALKLLALKDAVDQNHISTSQAAQAQSLLMESFNVTQLQANISAMGALATPTQQYDVAIARLTLDLNQGKISQFAFVAGAIAAKQSLDDATLSIKSQYGLASDADIASAAYTKYNQQMAAIGATAEQSAAGLPALTKQIQASIDAARAAGSAFPQFTQLLQDLKNPNKTTDELLTTSANAILQAGQGFTQALQQGQTVAQAIATSLTSAANSVANAFATAGAKSIAGAFLGTNTATAGSGGMAGAISSALGLGAGSLAGGLATGGISMAIGAGISMITGSITQSQQAQQAWQQAQQNWAGMASQVDSFTQQMDSGGNGSLTSALSSAKQQAQSFADAAHKAGQSADEINAALATFADREVSDFISSFNVFIDSLNAGLGFNSPAVTAAQNVQSVATQLEGFIQDTETVASTIGGATAAVQAAQSASQSYALSLLQTAPTLDTIETQFVTIQGTAAQLGSVLQDLGMSADQAAAAIKSGVNQAIASLQVSFTQTLQQQINTAQGNDWINQLQALFASSNQNLTDAQMLGLDPSLVADAFQAQAQQIVDSANLTGTAFDKLIQVFPQLADVVTQSTTAIQQQIAYYQQLQTTITSYLNGLNVGNLSPLSPADQLASAQSTYQSQLALAQGGNTDALNNITNTASSYLQTAQSYYASGAGYAAIYNQVQQDLKGVVPTAEANDPLTKIANNTATTNQILTVLQSLNQSTTDSSTTIAQAIQSLGALSADVANGQSTQFFGPMTSYLAQIAANTATSGTPAQAPQKSEFDKFVTFDWKNLHDGGIVGRFAPGGLVGNGIYGIDSVRARYATGGDIMLAGGEFVTRAPSVNAGTLAALQQINRTGRLPANDNSAAFASVGSMIVQAVGAAAMMQVGGLGQRIDALGAKLDGLTREVKSQKRPQRLGTKKAA